MDNRVQGQILDIHNREIFSGEVIIEDGRIADVRRCSTSSKQVIAPGFVDSHIHVESSMLTPSRFAALAVRHGTIGTVSDPHEIANVLGADGVHFMLEDAKRVPFKFHFGAPSCVPATSFESAGAIINSTEVAALLSRDDIYYLSEMMNYPGVLTGNPEVLEKLSAARERGKVVDGHAPGLRGEDVLRYAAAGISTDHECFDIDEAREKLNAGMKVIIREGSAAKNFDVLIPLLKEFPEKIMFCSDDRHPDDLRDGHINELVHRALKMGYNIFDVWRAANLNPTRHYGLTTGCLQKGDPADFIVLDDLTSCRILQTYIDGICVARDGTCLFPTAGGERPNRMECGPITSDLLKVPVEGKDLRVISIVPGQLITEEMIVPVTPLDFVQSDTERDVLKLVVINRYKAAPVAIAFVHGFNFSHGAIASSIAHDSHNIIAAGCTDEEIVMAVNSIIECGGGISLTERGATETLSLPVAGLMSDKDGFEIAALYESLSNRAKELGSDLPAPYMTLSFLALLVIPRLKLSDMGLFDGSRFSFVSLFSE